MEKNQFPKAKFAKNVPEKTKNPRKFRLQSKIPVLSKRLIQQRKMAEIKKKNRMADIEKFQVKFCFFVVFVLFFFFLIFNKI